MYLDPICSGIFMLNCFIFINSELYWHFFYSNFVHLLNMDVHVSGMIFLKLFNWFQLFCVNEKYKSCRIWSEQVKNDPFERGCRWFQLFFNDFQLFYFLTRIIPDVYIYGLFFYRMPISWDIDMGSLANKELKVQLKSHRPSLSGSSLPMFTHNIVSTMNSYLSLLI